MLKRLRWLGTGVAVGFGGSLWAQRKMKSMASRYRPSGRAGNAATKAKALPADVVAAVREGKVAMRERESELRALGGSRPGRSPR